jgi:hypothetical protein
LRASVKAWRLVFESGIDQIKSSATSPLTPLPSGEGNRRGERLEVVRPCRTLT